MNARTAKRLREQAKRNVYAWYSSLLEEDQVKELTYDLALQYTPTVKYWTDQSSRQIHVSEGTLRWFILQEKKKHHARSSKLTNTVRISL